MSTHEIQFHDIFEKMSLNFCFLELSEDFHGDPITGSSYP